MARATAAVIPIPIAQADPHRAEDRSMTSNGETSGAATTEERAEPAAVASEPAVRGITLQDIARWLSRRITRERIITLVLGCVSIGTLFLVWYLGTKYRFEFYIRF